VLPNLISFFHRMFVCAFDFHRCNCDEIEEFNAKELESGREPELVYIK